VYGTCSGEAVFSESGLNEGQAISLFPQAHPLAATAITRGVKVGLIMQAQLAAAAAAAAALQQQLVGKACVHVSVRRVVSNGAVLAEQY